MKTILIIPIIALFALSIYYILGTVEEVNCLVTEKERINTTESSKYLIFCEGEVLENTDSLLHGKFNSSDIYSKLKVDEEFKLDVYGWRIPFLSNYRNIIKITD